MTRRFRLQPARPGRDPALADLIAAAGAGAAVAAPDRSHPDALSVGRFALLVVAGAQVALAVPALVLGRDHGSPVHVAHEMGALQIAVGLGFAVAARRPSRAVGLLPAVTAAAILLVVTGLVDLASGRTSLADEAPHLVVVAGWIGLRFVAFHAPPDGATRRLSRADRSSWSGRWRRYRAPTAVGRSSGSVGEIDLRDPGGGPARPSSSRSGGGPPWGSAG